jgi:hypothetical protein
LEIWGLSGGSQNRKAAKVKSKVAFRLNRGLRISMRRLRVIWEWGAAAVAMAIRKEERVK